MEDMKSLFQIIVEKGDAYQLEEIDAEHLVGIFKDQPVVIRAVLDNTAVVHPLNDNSPAVRRLAKLEAAFVWPRDIRWKLRPASSIFGRLHA